MNNDFILTIPSQVIAYGSGCCTSTLFWLGLLAFVWYKFKDKNK